MRTTNSLQDIYEGWNGYHQSIVNAVKPLTPEQLHWRPAENFNSVGELVRHISLGRLTWLLRMGAPGSAEVAKRISEWEQDSDGNSNIVETSIAITEQPAELVHWLDLTWQIVENSLTSWTVEDLFQTYKHRWNDQVYDVSRQWTLWRVMNHDLHHGGELSLMLGLQGLEAFELSALFGHIISPPLENYQKRLQESQQYWDDLASTFDNELDHGLGDALIRETWTEFLKSWLPPTGVTVLDIGCGTGSLSIVLAELGYKVTGIDLSPAMISHAHAKAATHGFQIEFHVMDAAFPQLSHQQFDVIICRHLLWALPEPEQVLQRWTEFLKPKGRLILIEGFWVTGAGLRAPEIIKMLPASLINVSHQDLSDNPNFWGGNVTDERYAIIADNNK